MRDATHWKNLVSSRLGAIGLPPTRLDTIADEVSQHLEDRCAELIGRGVSEAEAIRVVSDELPTGSDLERMLVRFERRADPAPVVLGEPLRAGWLTGLWRDVRFAARTLARKPLSTGIAALALALAVGAMTSLFTFADAILLRPPAFAASDRLVRFWGTAPDKGLPVVNYPDALYEHYRSNARTITTLAMYRPAEFTLTGEGSAEHVRAANVTVDFFRTLGVSPAHGRVFRPEEERRGSNLVTVLSYGFWQRRFGGDSSVVGRAVTLGGIPTVVVGIAPRGFDFPNRSELWIPAPIDAQSLDCWCFDAIATLAPGKTSDDLVREVEALNAAFWSVREPGRPRAAADPNAPPGTIANSLARELTKEIRAPLLVALGGAILVLFAACANLAGLMLVRATTRAREIAVRCCLGASTWRIVRQMLAESFVLAAVGATAGLVIALAVVNGVGPFLVERVPHLQGIRADPRLLAVVVLAAVVTVLVFGLVPALQATRLQLDATLRSGWRSTGSRTNRRLRDGFVVVQFALALVLLTGCGVLVRSLMNIQALDPGFRADGVLVGRISLPWTAYRDPERRRAYFAQLEQRLRDMPGVVGAGLTSTAPFSAGDTQQELVIEGREVAATDPVPVTSIRSVSPGYFDAIGTPLIGGRTFEGNDNAAAEPIVIVDESLARRFWPGESAIGRRVRLPGLGPSWRTVIGVVASVRHGSLSRSIDHYAYVPVAQIPMLRMDVVARASADASPLITPLRGVLREMDPDVPLYDVRALGEAVSASLATRRATNGVLLGFAGAALLLAAIGIYGVIALSVASRSGEFGVRLALGATPRQIISLVLSHGVRLVLVATVIGIAGGVVATRLTSTLLFGVHPGDPATFVAGALALAAVALVACYAPARRASRIDAVGALRGE